MNLVRKTWHTARALGPRRTVQFLFKLATKPNPRHLWNEDQDFTTLYRQVSAYTLVDIRRAFMIYQFARHSAHVPGDAAEVGVYQGGTAKLISRALADTSKTVHLFDTFSGVPAATPGLDFHQRGDFRDTSVERVTQHLRDCRNVVIHPGFFPETAGPLSEVRFAFAYVDVDVYSSVWDSCVYFYPRMGSGAILLLDDYGSVTCEGARRAVDEFFADKNEKPCYLPTGQCLILKLA